MLKTHADSFRNPNQRSSCIVRTSVSAHVLPTDPEPCRLRTVNKITTAQLTSAPVTTAAVMSPPPSGQPLLRCTLKSVNAISYRSLCLLLFLHPLENLFGPVNKTRVARDSIDTHTRTASIIKLSRGNLRKDRSSHWVLVWWVWRLISIFGLINTLAL